MKLNISDANEQYLSERRRNAFLLSRIQNLTGNIQVFCRVRPLLDRDDVIPNSSQKHALEILNPSEIAAIEVKPESSFKSTKKDSLNYIENAPWKVFAFDRIIGSDESQLDVFRELEPIAQSVVDGYKACVFAYGQVIHKI